MSIGFTLTPNILEDSTSVHPWEVDCGALNKRALLQALIITQNFEILNYLVKTHYI